jgi:hypothetical protein
LTDERSVDFLSQQQPRYFDKQLNNQMNISVSPVSTASFSTSGSRSPSSPRASSDAPYSWLAASACLTPVIVQLAEKSFLLTNTLTPYDYQTDCNELDDYNSWNFENSLVEHRIRAHIRLHSDGSGNAPIQDCVFETEEEAHREAWMRHELLPESFKQPLVSRRYLIANRGKHILYVYVVVPTKREYAPSHSPLHRCSAECKVCTSEFSFTSRDAEFAHAYHAYLYDIALDAMRCMDAGYELFSSQMVQ